MHPVLAVKHAAVPGASDPGWLLHWLGASTRQAFLANLADMISSFQDLVWGGIGFHEGAYVIKCGVVIYERVVC